MVKVKWKQKGSILIRPNAQKIEKHIMTVYGIDYNYIHQKYYNVEINNQAT